MLSCQENKDPTRIPLLNASQETIEFSSSGGNGTLVITMNGNSWVASLNQAWCSISDKASSMERTDLTIVAAPNTSNEARATTLSFTMDSKETIYVNLKQEGKTAVVPIVYPSYSNWQQSDDTGMSSDAFALAAKMEVGWNLDNSLEVPGNETDWDNPKTTQAFIDAVKTSGINAIRIPCSWNSYIENTNTWKLKDSWLARVKEVVDYCYQNDMYVIINAHWDGGWLENNPTFAKRY
jgi:aryl-phospho-beta-D-glucosidase BglC (GH1 family)